MSLTLRNRTELRRRAGLFTIGEAAEMLGVNHWAFRYQVAAGHLVQPSVRIGSKARRYYTDEDVDQMRRYFGARDQRKNKTRPNRVRAARGVGGVWPKPTNITQIRTNSPPS